MSKVRPPVTFHRALTRIADLLGWDGCAVVLNKSESLIRKLSDPDTERAISLQDALRLDMAFIRAGGEGAPMHECYALRLKEVQDDACDDDVINVVGIVAKEAGEAMSATIQFSMTPDCPKARAHALTEAEEAIGSFTRLLRKLVRTEGK